MQEHFQKCIEKQFLILKGVRVKSDLKSVQNYYSAHQRYADIKKYMMDNFLHDIFECTFKLNENDVPTTRDYLNLLDDIVALKI